MGMNMLIGMEVSFADFTMGSMRQLRDGQIVLDGADRMEQKSAWRIP